MRRDPAWNPRQKFPTAVSVAAIVGELKGAATWLKRNKVKVDDSLIDNLILRVSFIQPKTGDRFFLQGTFDNYKIWPPMWDWFDETWSDNEGKHLSPARASITRPMFFEDDPRDKGIICAPFSRLTYGMHGGPHSDWRTLEDWNKYKHPKIMHADTIGDMLQLIQYDLVHSAGRMGMLPSRYYRRQHDLHHELLQTVHKALALQARDSSSQDARQLVRLFHMIEERKNLERDPMRRAQLQQAIIALEHVAPQLDERAMIRQGGSPQQLIQRVRTELTRLIRNPLKYDQRRLNLLNLELMRMKHSSRDHLIRKQLLSTRKLSARMVNIAALLESQPGHIVKIKRMLSELMESELRESMEHERRFR